ncbi:hypothetical protein EYF80_009285 [Liparis tanakae]|uniref:Uncharacterized protein n=1 Tax=Liparis tanakae TaxID=230148 RepID=A0A4Z2IRV9_9TELE|nr:hypothetical protein EYF80_009285 [Liparis tanakae]
MPDEPRVVCFHKSTDSFQLVLTFPSSAPDINSMLVAPRAPYRTTCSTGPGCATLRPAPPRHGDNRCSLASGSGGEGSWIRDVAWMLDNVGTKLFFTEHNQIAYTGLFYNIVKFQWHRSTAKTTLEEISLHEFEAICASL